MIPESIEWLEKCELPLAKYILGKSIMMDSM